MSWQDKVFQLPRPSARDVYTVGELNNQEISCVVNVLDSNVILSSGRGIV